MGLAVGNGGFYVKTSHPKPHYVFEVELLREMLNEHLESKNLFCKYRTRQDEEYYSNKCGNTYNHFSYAEMKSRYYFGLSLYDKVLEMLNNNSSKLKRPLDLLYEHKIMMNSRIEYMNQNGYISNEDYIAMSEKCEKLIYKTLLARNLWIKYSMTIGNTNSSELLKKIYNYHKSLLPHFGITFVVFMEEKRKKRRSIYGFNHY